MQLSKLIFLTILFNKNILFKMEKPKCSSSEHKEIEAIIFCKEFKIYLCNKCEKHHSEINKDHHHYKLDKNFREIFSGFCKEEKHINELIYFCKTHNTLCCAECITKLKAKNNGNHSNCEICLIKDIEKEKKSKLKENIKTLESLSNNLQQIIDEFKKTYEEINNRSEELKMKIQKIFTNIRNEINKREDELLLEVDKKIGSFFLNKDYFKNIDKIPNQVKISLENGKILENNWNEKYLNESLYNCLNIENMIKSIYELKEKVKQNNLNDLNLNMNFNEQYCINNISRFLKENLIESEVQNNILNESNIIKTQKEKEKLFSFFNKKFKSIELIYRGTRDGDSAKIFHQKCDNRGPTLILCKEKNNGIIFGGYTEVNWDSEKRHSKSDKNAFIFSITNNKKIETKNYETSIECNPLFGPIFGFGGDITIVGNFLSYESNMWSEQKTYFDKNYEITNGKKYFILGELEVYILHF